MKSINKNTSIINCQFPACKREAIKGIYCYDHNRLMGTAKEVKPVKEIPKSSEKGKEIKDELKKRYPKYLKKHPFCNIKSPVCTKIAVCVNHTQGRGKNEVLNEETWEPSCIACNSYIEQHPDWNDRQHKKRRHGK